MSNKFTKVCRLPVNIAIIRIPDAIDCDKKRMAKCTLILLNEFKSTCLSDSFPKIAIFIFF